MWNHTPITDFWSIGKGYAKKLAAYGMYTMGDVARCSIGSDNSYHNEELLYKLFGVNAELLIDHAWGWEPCTISDIKAYKPITSSLTSGQVLKHPYPAFKAKLVTKEMVDSLVLDLVKKKLVTDQVILTIEYKDFKHAHGTANLECYTSSTKRIMEAVSKLFDKIVDPKLLIRKVNLSFNHIIDETKVLGKENYQQLKLFSDYRKQIQEWEQEEERLKKERSLQEAVINIKERYGKNAILKGMILQEDATARERNNQIGGHKA